MLCIDLLIVAYIKRECVRTGQSYLVPELLFHRTYGRSQRSTSYAAKRPANYMQLLLQTLVVYMPYFLFSLPWLRLADVAPCRSYTLPWLRLAVVAPLRCYVFLGYALPQLRLVVVTPLGR
jgi:hypothetical protein